MPWFRLDDGFHSHPKVLAAGNEAVGLYVRCGAYCSQHLTEGFVPQEVALLYGTRKAVQKLVEVGLWTVAEVGQAGWVMPDYLEYNPSREQVQTDRAAAAERQRRARERARESRQQSRRDSRDDDDVSHGPPDPTRPLSAEPDGSAPGDRPDVDELCEHLADRIEANGSKRPTVTKRWRDACRLLIDRDGRTPEQVRAAIDWCQADEFWRTNVLSMPTLREQYDRLRLAAQRPAGRQPHQAFRNPDNPDQAYGGQL